MSNIHNRRQIIISPEQIKERKRKAAAARAKSIIMVAAYIFVALLGALIVIGVPVGVVVLAFLALGESLASIINTGATPTNMAVLSAAVFIVLCVLASIVRAKRRA